MRIADCIDRAAAVYGVPKGEILGPSRLAGIVEARQAAMLLAVEAGHTPGTIGRLMGRDGSTVRHGAARARERAKISGVPRDWLFVGARNREALEIMGVSHV